MSARIFVAVALLLAAILSAPPAAGAENPPPASDSDLDYEELLRGPVHEAFAEQYNPDPQPGPMVPVEPPAPVEELPPEVRPEGDDVDWIPGYWAWDDEQETYVWVSGIWRHIPPGMQWLPGYWAEVEGGWQWVPGTWFQEEVAELEYLPEPPASLELGPVGNPPTPEHIWIPGTWRYQATRYVWRPGYWTVGRAQHVWIPARYIWTPRGCLYVEGYWDYPLDARGHLFAPVRFYRPVYATPGFYYTPTVYISSTVLMDHFWVRPGYRHYYFGDYYSSHYVSLGIFPWFRFTYVQRRAYDPIYAYVRYRPGSTWVESRRRWSSRYDWYVRHADWRPPRTWNQQAIVQNNVVHIDNRQYTQTDITNINNIFMGRSLREDGGRRNGRDRMVQLAPEQREDHRRQFDRTRSLSDGRRQVESSRFADMVERREGSGGGRPEGGVGRGSLRLSELAESPRDGRSRHEGQRPERPDRDVPEVASDRAETRDRGRPATDRSDPATDDSRTARSPRTERPSPDDTTSASDSPQDARDALRARREAVSERSAGSEDREGGTLRDRLQERRDRILSTESARDSIRGATPETGRPASPSRSSAPEASRPALPSRSTSPETGRSALPSRPSAPGASRPTLPSRSSAPEASRPALPSRSTSPETGRSALPSRPSAPEASRPALPSRPSTPGASRPALPSRATSPETGRSALPSRSAAAQAGRPSLSAGSPARESDRSSLPAARSSRSATGPSPAAGGSSRLSLPSRPSPSSGQTPRAATRPESRSAIGRAAAAAAERGAARSPRSLDRGASGRGSAAAARLPDRGDRGRGSRGRSND